MPVGSYYRSFVFLEKLGIQSYPYEIIFSKSGREMRRFAGFTRDSQKDYLEKTTELIERLVIQ